jgi:gluconolactonase
MTIKLLYAALALGSLMAVVADLPLAASVTPVKVAQTPGYCEGIVFDRAGSGYVSDTQHDTIYRVSPDGKVDKWAVVKAPNGHRVLADGSHLVAAAQAVVHLSANGKLLNRAASTSDGDPLVEPNDIALDPNGGFYFTDPHGSTAARPVGSVHYTDPGETTHTIATGLAYPNGIVLRPDGRTLLVGESEHNRILSYAVIAPGRLGERRVFATLPSKAGDQIANAPDGMALDEDGNLFVAHYGMRTVQVLSPEGRLLRSYPAGNLTASNVAFGGAAMDQLYVTGALADEQTSPGALWRVALKGVRGRRLLPLGK